MWLCVLQDSSRGAAGSHDCAFVHVIVLFVCSCLHAMINDYQHCVAVCFAASLRLIVFQVALRNASVEAQSTMESAMVNQR